MSRWGKKAPQAVPVVLGFRSHRMDTWMVRCFERSGFASALLGVRPFVQGSSPPANRWKRIPADPAGLSLGCGPDRPTCFGIRLVVWSRCPRIVGPQVGCRVVRGLGSVKPEYAALKRVFSEFLTADARRGGPYLSSRIFEKATSFFKENIEVSVDSNDLLSSST